MEKKLSQITSLIESFNKEEFKFVLELRIINKEKRAMLRLDQILNMVCNYTGLTPEYLNMKTREKHIVIPRQIAHYLAAKNTKLTLTQIGAFFGGKDHATVLYSVKTIEGYLRLDHDFRRKYGELLNFGGEIITD